MPPTGAAAPADEQDPPAEAFRGPLATEGDDRRTRRHRPAVRQQRFDYGGSTYLSNDDSMSLASAQRLLWSLDNGKRPTPSEVRPHELLNYFRFDTAQPKGSDTFEVTASAKSTGDTLAVAFAVQGATPKAAPLDLTVLIDRSCSMDGQGRMDYTKRGLEKMIGQLNPGDRVVVVVFSDNASTVLENHIVGRNDRALHRAFANITPGGGTNLGAGLREAYAVASRKADVHKRNRRLMVISDARLNQGQVDRDVIATVGERLETDGIRLTGVGVGRDFDDAVLDKLTEKGKGAYVYLGSEAVVDRVFGEGFPALTQTIAHDVRFQMHLPQSLALKRFYGEAASTNKADIQPIHYFAGTSQVFLQDLQIGSDGLDRSAEVALDVSWKDALTGEPESRRFTTTVGQMLSSNTHNVTKAKALMAWTDVVSGIATGGSTAKPCQAFLSRARGLQDAEIDYVSNLIVGHCGSSKVRTLSFSIDDPTATSVEVTCNSGGFRQRASIQNGHAEMADVPMATCRAKLKGSLIPDSTQLAMADTRVSCTTEGGHLSCR